jgi:hypothetical protein
MSTIRRFFINFAFHLGQGGGRSRRCTEPAAWHLLLPFPKWLDAGAMTFLAMRKTGFPSIANGLRNHPRHRADRSPEDWPSNGNASMPPAANFHCI